MGVADLVPGISGGTVALITGIYKELIKSIDHIKLSTIFTLFRKGFKAFWKNINGPFLMALFGGIITSILFFSRLIEYLIENESVRLWALFFGLLVASIIYLIKENKIYSTLSIGLVLLGMVISASMSFFTPSTIELNYPYLFFCGLIAISAMILPGLSGAYILMILGAYKLILSTVRKAQDLLFAFDSELFYEVFSILGVFIFGIVVGIKLFSKVLYWLFKKYPNNTIAVLVGLMVGALHKVWPWQNEVSSFATVSKNVQTTAVLPQNFEGDPQLLSALFLMVFGFFILFVLERLKSNANG